MSYDFILKAPSDCGQVELGEAEERLYWTDRLDVSERLLEEAVRMMGSNLEGVTAYLAHFRKWPIGGMNP